MIEGSLTVSTHFPDNVMLHDLDFVGSGGTGLTASASAVINHCSFTGYDIGADVEDGGMIGVESCTFRQNGIGLPLQHQQLLLLQDRLPGLRSRGKRHRRAVSEHSRQHAAGFCGHGF